MHGSRSVDVSLSAQTRGSVGSGLASIRRERSLRKIAFGIPVQSLQLPVSAQGEWAVISADVLAGNNAGSASVSFGQALAMEFAPPSTPPAS